MAARWCIKSEIYILQTMNDNKSSLPVEIVSDTELNSYIGGAKKKKSSSEITIKIESKDGVTAITAGIRINF